MNDEEKAALEKELLEIELKELQAKEAGATDDQINNPLLNAVNTFQNDLVFDHAPEIHAAVKADSPEQYAKLRDANRKIMIAQQAKNPASTAAAKTAAFAASFANPILGVAKNPVVNNTINSAIQGALQNPGDTESGWEEALKRTQNAGTAAVTSLGFQKVGLPIVKGVGSFLYKRGVAPITHAVNKTLADDIYPFMEKHRITGSLKDMGATLEKYMKTTGGTVGNILDQAQQKGARVNHQQLSAKLKSKVLSPEVDPGEQDAIQGLHNYVDESITNYKTDAFRAAEKAYEKKVAQTNAFNSSQLDKTKLDKIKTALTGRTVMQKSLPDAPAQNPYMSLEAANNFRQSLGFRARQGFGNKQSYPVPSKTELTENLYPVLRSEIDDQVKQKLGQQKFDIFAKANKDFSLLKPSMDTIKKAALSEDAPKKGFTGALQELGEFVVNAKSLTKVGDTMKNAAFNGEVTLKLPNINKLGFRPAPMGKTKISGNSIPKSLLPNARYYKYREDEEE